MRPYSTRREYQHSRILLPSAMSAKACRAVIDFPVQLKDLRILDVGAGQSDCVAWLNSQGADAYAVDSRYRDLQRLEGDMDNTLNAKFRKVEQRYGTSSAQLLNTTTEKTRDRFRQDLTTNKRRYISALAGNLPFPGGVFDFVYSIDCIGKGLDEDENLFRQVIQDSLRVLTDGGELQIYPFLGNGSSLNAKNQRKVLTHVPHSIERVGGSELDYSFRARIIRR